MRKITNLFILSALTLCAFCLGTSVVEAQATANNFQITCNPATIEKGQVAKCYLLAQLTSDGGVGIDGIITKVTTGGKANTQNIDIKDVHPAPAKIGEIVAEPVDHGSTPKEGSGAGAISYQCQNSNAQYNKCYMFYAKAGKSITPVPEFADNAVQELTGYTGYTVIGYYSIQLKENANMKDCGRLCVQVEYSATPSGYSSLASSGTTCSEVSPSGVPTGSFASYTLLIGAAFVALGAITLAKKHNKFYRV